MSKHPVAFVLGLFCLFSGLCAAEALFPPPPHPTALQAEYKGVLYDVVAVQKGQPVIILDKQRKVLKGSVPLMTQRAASYAGNSATLTNFKTENLQLVNVATEVEAVHAAPEATIGGYLEVTGTITAAQDLTDCYFALVAFDPAFLDGGTDKPNAEIRVRQLPDLKKGVPTNFKIGSPPLNTRKRHEVAGMLFSSNSEVQTNFSGATNAYFARRERIIHQAVVTRWLETKRQGNHPLKPLVQVPPLFESTEGFPKTAFANLTVAADGTVSALTLEGDFTPAAQITLSISLGAWLFLPQIQEGRPTSATVKVPLTF